MKISDRLASAGYLVSWAARLSARLIDQELKPHGIAPGYLPVLFSLGDGGAMSPSALAKAGAIENPTMTNTLARMERDGLVLRQPHPSDGRSTLVSCSPETLALWRTVKPRLDHLNADILAAIPAERREAWLDDLRAVIARLNQMTGAGPDDQIA